MAITKMRLFETGAPERKSPAEHHPALTNCFFHSSALIGSSLMPYTASTFTWSVNKPRWRPSPPAPSAAPLAAAMPTGLARASPWFNKLPLPLFSAHRLVRDGINDVTVFRALDEHSEALTQDDKGCQLVVHLDRKSVVWRKRVDLGG